MAEPLPPAEPVAPTRDPEQLAPEPAAPESTVQRTSDGRIIMRTRDGLQTVSEDQAERFMAEGRGLPATAGDVHESDLQRQYGEGISNELRTGVEAAADVTTLGGYSAATRIIGGDDAATGLRERYARNPGSKVAGELAAIGTLGVLTAGSAGALGTAGAIARATPAGAALRAGMAAERGLSALGGSGALSQIGALTAAGTIEGALFGAGQGVQEIALSERDTDRTAEAMLAHLGRTAGEGAALGLLGGFGAGAVLQGASAIGRRAQRALTRAEEGFGARVTKSGPAGQASRSSSDSASSSSSRGGSSAESLTEAGSAANLKNRSDITIELEPGIDMRKPLQRMQDQASAAKRLDIEREAFVPDVTAKLTDIDQAADLLAASARKIKPRNAQKALDELPIANYEATVARGAELLDTMAADTQRFLDDPLLREGIRGRGATSLARVREAADAVVGALPQGLKTKQGATYWTSQATENAAKLWGELNYYKAIVGRAADAAKDSAARASLDDHYHLLQQYLEDESLWGGMARINKTINPGWSRWLTSKTVDTDLLSEAPRRSLSDPFRQGRQGDSAKTQGLFDALSDVRGQTRAQNAVEWLDAQDDFARLVEEAYELGPSERALVKQLRDARKDVASKINQAVRTHADAREFRELGGALNELPLLSQAFKTIKVSASSLSNAALATSTKSGAKAAAGASVDAASSARSAANAELMQRASRLEGARSAASSVLSAVATASRALASSSSRTIKNTLPAAAAVASLSTSERFARAYRATSDFERDPQAAVRRTWKAQGDLARFAPKLAAAQAQRQVALMTLLASKLPQHEEPSIYGDNSDVPKATPSEQAEFLRYYRAASDPLSVIEDAADGRLTREGVEVLKVGYPQLYDSLQRGVLDALQSAEQKPPYQKRLMLGQLLDLPTDPGLEPDMLAALQRSAQSTPMPTQEQGGVLAPSARKAPNTAGAQQTKTDRLAGGR